MTGVVARASSVTRGPVATDRKDRGAIGGEDRGRVEIDGEATLLEQLEGPLHRVLAVRAAYYRVRVEGIGRCGEVLVGITGAKGQLPLLFGREELEPGYVARVVNDTLDRFAF